MVFSAMVTPDANPVTMLLMFAALVGLYEVSLLIARIVLARRIKRQQEEGTYLGDDDDDESTAIEKAESSSGLSKQES